MCYLNIIVKYACSVNTNTFLLHYKLRTRSTFGIQGMIAHKLFMPSYCSNTHNNHNNKEIEEIELEKYFEYSKVTFLLKLYAKGDSNSCFDSSNIITNMYNKYNKIRKSVILLMSLQKYISNIYIYNLARTPEIGQGLGRILSCVACKPEQT